MQKIVVLSLVLLFLSFTNSGDPKNSVVSYISEWRDVAVQQMNEHGIPASITLAQGILESRYGTSKLAVDGNNHFGIKCNGWPGAKIYHDDDAKNECFRKYMSAAASYEDHSLFLTQRSRYAFLFEYEITDYKKWAKGLKKAGYATNPKYANLLIELIEKYELNEYDQIIEMETNDVLTEVADSETVNSEKQTNDEKEAPVKEEPSNKRKVFVNSNRTKFIRTQEGDTFFQIAKDTGLTLRQLHKYNDFPPTKDHLNKGDIVYIMPKRNKGSRQLSKVALEESKPAWEVSQNYGIKLKRIMELNDIASPDSPIEKGAVIAFR